MNLLQVLLTRKDEVLAFLNKEPQTVCFTQDCNGLVNCYEINNPGFSSEVWKGTGFIDYISTPEGDAIKFIKASNHRTGIVSVDTFKAAAYPDEHPAVLTIEDVLDDVFRDSNKLIAKRLLAAIQQDKIPGVKATGGYWDYTKGNTDMFKGAPEWATVFGTVVRNGFTYPAWASSCSFTKKWVTKNINGGFVVQNDELNDLFVRGERVWVD